MTCWKDEVANLCRDSYFRASVLVDRQKRPRCVILKFLLLINKEWLGLYLDLYFHLSKQYFSAICKQPKLDTLSFCGDKGFPRLQIKDIWETSAFRVCPFPLGFISPVMIPPSNWRLQHDPNLEPLHHEKCNPLVNSAAQTQLGLHKGALLKTSL